MKLLNWLDTLSWKKIVMITLMTGTVMYCIHEMHYWRDYRGNQDMVANLSSQIDQQQKEIQTLLSDSEKAFHDRGRRFDTNAAEFSNQVDKFQSDMNNYLAKSEHDREVRQKEFDQAFSEAPAKMWEEHLKAAEELRKGFLKESAQMQKDFHDRVFRQQQDRK